MNFGILILIIPNYIDEYLFLDDIQTGIMSAIYPISIVIGSILGGIVSDKYGRKPTIYISVLQVL